MIRRRFTSFLLVLIVFCAAALPAFWFGASLLLRQGLEAWADDRRREGYEVEHGVPQLAGFPFRLDYRLPDPRLKAPDGWVWDGPELSGETAIWTPLTIALQGPGRHVVAWGSPQAPMTAEILATSVDGRLKLATSGKLQWADARLQNLNAQGSFPGPLHIKNVDFLYQPPEITTGPYDQGKLQVSASEVGLPPTVEAPLGKLIEEVSFEGRMAGPGIGDGSRQALSAWRDAGGAVEIERFGLRWGPLELEAEGQVGLDAELRPLGNLKTKVRGAAATVELLLKQGLIAKQAASGIKIAIFAMSRDGGDGGPPVVDLPVSLRDGLLYLGPVALFRLRPVL